MEGKLHGKQVGMRAIALGVHHFEGRSRTKKKSGILGVYMKILGFRVYIYIHRCPDVKSMLSVLGIVRGRDARA